MFAVQISHSYSIDAPRVPYGKTTISNLGVEFDFEAADLYRNMLSKWNII